MIIIIINLSLDSLVIVFFSIWTNVSQGLCQTGNKVSHNNNNNNSK